jgi:hypothetical protein
MAMPAALALVYHRCTRHQAFTTRQPTASALAWLLQAVTAYRRMEHERVAVVNNLNLLVPAIGISSRYKVNSTPSRMSTHSKTCRVFHQQKRIGLYWTMNQPGH